MKYKTYEELKDELGDKYDKLMYDINLDLIKKIETAVDKLQLLIDIGFDYDGLNRVCSLKCLIDELVGYAKESKNILVASLPYTSYNTIVELFCRLAFYFTFSYNKPLITFSSHFMILIDTITNINHSIHCKYPYN